MSVLGELVRPNGGDAWTQTLIETMDLLGVQQKAARQAIARMHERGWLTRTKVGRRTRWHLTDTADVLLETGARRIYDFGAGVLKWDRRWLVLLASVPESDRNLRYRMSVGLNWAGFGSLGQGTWLSPWTSQEAAVVPLLEDLGVNATSFLAELGRIGSGASLAAQAWDLPALRDRYDAFMADTERLVDHLEDGPSSVVDLIALVHAWRRFPFVDPDLPRELLPIDWPAASAALRFKTLRSALVGPATEWWRDMEASVAPVP